MRLSFRLFATAFMCASAASARADVIYNLTLTSTQGNPGGSGSFTVNRPPPSTGTVTYDAPFDPTSNYPGTPGYTLTAFQVSVAGSPGRSLSLQDLSAPNFPYIEFTNGVVTNLHGFSINGGQRSTGFYSFGLDETIYVNSFSYLPAGQFPYNFNDSGSVTITPAATAATPEPSSITLLGIGLIGVRVALRRRFA